MDMVFDIDQSCWYEMQAAEYFFRQFFISIRELLLQLFLGQSQVDPLDWQSLQIIGTLAFPLAHIFFDTCSALGSLITL